MADHPEFTPEQRARFCEELCSWLEDGNTLRAFCRLEGKPRKSLFYEWMESDPAFGGRVAHARARGYDAIAEHALEIADDYGGEVNRDKLRVDTRWKLLRCWDPKRYGDKPEAAQEPSEGEGDKLLRDLNEAKRRGGDRAP